MRSAFSVRPGADEAAAALDAFRPTGDVLELACGPGAWTERLLRHGTSLNAVVAAPEMLARAKSRVGEDRVRFIQTARWRSRPARPTGSPRTTRFRDRVETFQAGRMG